MSTQNQYFSISLEKGLKLPPLAINTFHDTSFGKAYLSTSSEDPLKQMLGGMTLVAKITQNHHEIGAAPG
jgi:hypothetical protein